MPADEEGFDAAVRRVATHQNVVGLSVAVVRPGEVLWSRRYGAADLATDTSTSVHTSYLWFSMTKIVTATAVMQLAEQGRINLDAPVEDYLPDFAVVRQPTPVTARHLLAHSSGLANPAPVRWIHPAGMPGPDAADFLRTRLARHRKLRFRPGERASYTNLGYLVLGQVVAHVSGASYTDYVTNRILEPAQMTETGFDGSPSDATVYQRARRPVTPVLRIVLPRGIVGPRYGRYLSYRPFRLDGAAYGGLIGPVADAARFLAAI